MADEFDPKKFLADTEPAFDPKAFLAKPAERTNTTLADYGDIYNEMRNESVGQIERGVRQLGAPTGGDLASSAWETAKGVGNIGFGALGFVGSPIAAGLRATIGEPGQQRFGIPKEYSEFAGSLAIPGIGLPRIPGTTAPNVVTKVTGPRTGPVADEARLLTKGGQETQAGLALRGAATDPAKAERALGAVDEILPGSKPTTFQASGDIGLGQLERGIANKESAPFIERRAQQGAARTEALEGSARPGNPEEVANDLRASVAMEEAGAAKLERDAIARAEQRIQQATARAQQADQAAGGTGFTPDISGQVFQRELAEANTVNRNAASRLWDMIDPQGRLSVNASPVINAEFRARSNMALADAETVTDAERKIAGVIAQYSPVTSFKEMRALRSFISESMRDERRLRGETKAWGRMAQLRSAVEETVAAPFEAGAVPGPGAAAVSSDAAERLAAATAATKERAATFKVEPVQGIIKPGQGGEPKMTPSVVQGKIIPSGPKGYDTVNAYLRATEGRPGGGGLQEVSDALVADMRAHATAVDGSIDPGKLQSWANSKQHALRAVTERDNGALVQRLTGVQDTGLEVRATTKDLPVVTKQAAAERAAVSKKGNEGIFGDLMGVRDRNDISKLLGSIFGSKTAVADAEAVMARLATPEAQDGARRAITDWIASKLVSNTAAGTSEVNILRADQFQQFIKQNVAVLEKFGFAPEQIKTWQAIAADMRQAKMSIDATRAGAGSDTVQNYYAMKKFGLAGSKLSKILHLAGGTVGALTHGWLGAILGFVGAGKVSSLREGAIHSVQDLIVKGMLEPEFGRQLLAKVSPKESIALLRTLGLWGRRAARAEVLTGSRHDQPEPASKGYAYGGTVFPVGSEGIKARNKARAFEARERSSFARGAPKAKGKVKRADGGAVPYPIGSPEFKEEVARGLAKNQDTIAAAQEFYPRVPLNDKAWEQFIKDAPASINIEDRRGLRGAYRKADGGGVNDDSREPDPLEAELARRNVPGGLSATAGPTVTSTTPVQDIPAPKVNAEGETLPTYVLKEMGKGLLGAPEQFTHAAGDLQRRGEYAGSHEDLPYGGPPPEEMPAGAAAALMLYGANAPFPKPGIGVFGGRGALTANKGMLAEAEKMLAAGVPHATIRNRTGWEFGSEGKPKFEISDAESRIIPEAPSERVEGAQGGASRDTGFRPNKRLGEVFHHPELYEAYPWLRDMRTSIEVGEGIKPGAAYAPPTKSQKSFGKAGEIEVRAPTYERGGVGDLFEKQYANDVGARDMLLHEIQHAIQEREGFAPGSNPRQLPLKNSEVETIAKNMAVRSGVDWGSASLQEKQNMIRVVRHRIYKAQAGEAEARNVQTRADSTLPSRPSWETEDIKRENQMIDKNRKLKPGEKPFNDAKIYKMEPEPEPPRTVGRAAPAGGGRSSGIYKDPRLIAREAAELIPPEHPALKALFGVTREDLYGISQQGRRQGNLPDPLWTVPPPKARGSAAAEGIMNPGNEQRILDAMGEGGKHRGVLLADAWYVMDPAYQRLEYLHGPALAKRLYDRMNTTGAMTSPASGVWDEIRRGTAANMMAHQGQFPLWRDWAGIAMRHRPPPGQPFVPVPGKGGTSRHVEHLAGQKFPPQLREIPGHLAHRTAHAGPIEKYLESGVVEMGTPKVPTYIPASGVPETGFQTRWMVPDAHISKSLGMGDTRTQGTIRQGASMSMPEYRQIAPWYRHRIAEPLGVEAVPAQARQWTLFGPQTGVRTMLGIPKLELLAQRIWEQALKNGWDPKVLRDQVLSGGAYAGLAGGIIGPALRGLEEERPRE